MNKVCFTLFDNTVDPSVTSVNNTTYIYSNFDLYRIMPYMYWNYTAFNIKLEGFVTRTAGFNLLVDQQYNLLHMTGLNWVNGYDTQPGFENSRVIELISYEQNAPNQNPVGYNFPSNCNGIMFHRPSSPQVTLTLFITNVNTGQVQEFVQSDRGCFIFSINGIEKYKVNNYKLWREINTKEVSFVLKTSGAVQLDNRNRAFIWSNVHMCNVMGSIYHEYSKFQLVTQYIQPHQGASNPISNSVFNGVTCVMSGLPWISSSFPYLQNATSTTQYHTDQKSVVGLFSLTTQPFKEMSIVNTFDRPKSYADIVLTYASLTGLEIIGASAGTTQFTNVVIKFVIIPLE